MKILLAVDGSDYTRRMIDYVLNHRTLFDPSHRYTVLNVQAPLPPHAASMVGHRVAHEYYEDEARKVIEPVVAQMHVHNLPTEGEWKVGPAGETIAKTADEGGYDMLLLGSHGQGTWARLVLGSTANQVLAACGVPVLVVR